LSQRDANDDNPYESAWRTVNTGSNPVGATIRKSRSIREFSAVSKARASDMKRTEKVRNSDVAAESQQSFACLRRRHRPRVSPTTAASGIQVDAICGRRTLERGDVRLRRMFSEELPHELAARAGEPREVDTSDAGADQYGEGLEVVRPHVVRIETPRGSGTGFFIYRSPSGMAWIATACHVVASAEYWEEPIRVTHDLSGTSVVLHDNERVIILDKSGHGRRRDVASAASTIARRNARYDSRDTHVKVGVRRS
jgi:S1-C subfamily serine protease